MRGVRGDALSWLVGAVLGGLFVVGFGMRMFPTVWGGVWFWVAVAAAFLWVPAVAFVCWAFWRKHAVRAPLQELEEKAVRGEVDLREFHRIRDEVANTRRHGR